MSHPGGMPVEYWAVGGDLAGLVTGVHRYNVALPPGEVGRDVFFPSWATVRIAVGDSAPWSLKMGSRHWDPVPTLAFAGPTSNAGYITTNGGTLVGLGILPSGWAQLFGGDISRFANRIVPLTEIDPAAHAMGEALDAGEPPLAVFERWLSARAAARPPADPRLAQIYALLEDPTIHRAETIAERVGMTPRALATLTRTSFGFTPKLLLRRGRFLRALSAVLTRPAAGAEALEEAGYWDRSHFLRDSHLFLGCSIRDFNKRRGPLNHIALRVREDVLGAPV